MRSLGRVLAIFLKEVTQLRRDRVTFAMMLGIPLIQLILFGYAIDTDPRDLPTGVVIQEDSRLSRSILAGMAVSGYFAEIERLDGPAAADDALARGRLAFVVTVPTGFQAAVLRGERPALLVEADATDPAASSNALAALDRIVAGAVAHDLDRGLLAPAGGGAGPVGLVIHRRYNPEGETRYNIVPGLLGVILTMTMVMMTSIALAREAERGTKETLLSMPVRPAEVMAGTILPYIVIGYVQVLVILVAARLLFDVPMLGSPILLSAAVIVFIAANVAVGFTISTLVRNQVQAMQLTFFFFLPSILLSGFMFPFRGMPGWAQAIGELLPLTHFLRIVRGILLKGNGVAEVAPHIAPLLAFFAVVTTVALLRYRRTLD